MEKRRVEYNAEKRIFELLKPTDNGNFYKQGQRKTGKAVYDVLASRRYELIFSGIAEIVFNEYLKKKTKGTQYLKEGRLVSLTK